MRALSTSLTLAMLAAAGAGAWAGSPAPGQLRPLPRHETTGLLPGVVDPAQVHLAVPLDLEGRLSEALPLYRRRAEQTLTKTDRLRYAGALLRAGQADEARKVYGALLVESGATQHGGEQGPDLAALCVSSLLIEGFPALAVEYARPAHRSYARDRRLALLLIRALTAAGDAPGARAVIAEISTAMETWAVGERIELARAYLLVGDLQAARALLNRDVSESLGQMMRDSVFANIGMREGDWANTAQLLGDARRKGPPSLDETQVNRAWRNLQREVRSIELRRAVSLWKEGKRETAVDEAVRALKSDEEYVRSAARTLLVAGDLTLGSREQAVRRLQALAGHDHRFAPAVEVVAKALRAGKDPAESVDRLEDVLASEDRAAAFVTKPLFEIIREAAKASAAASVRAAAR